jgi:N-acetylglucosaminyldiphosphoundecaprenol N-acetyl-beta-D-mannosaminyltransferase
VDHLCRLQSDELFRRAYAHSFLTLADGVPVVWASRLMGAPIREKISGSDLVHWLSAHCAERGHSVFLFGAADGVAEKAGRLLQARYPGLRIVGSYSPPIGFEKDPARNSIALEQLRASRADLCFIALGSPKQEIWMHDHVGATGIPVLLGIGAGLDFVAGVSRRAPVWVQRIGLEWFWRLCHDPRRLAKRYLIDDSLFFLLLFREWRARMFARPASQR